MKVLLVPVLAAVVGSVLFTPRAALAQSSPQHVKAELLADANSVKPGGTITLGVLLTVDPHWHVYWSNPGDSGRPTTVKFQVPEGVTVGELRYPVPIKFKQPGDMVGYGYEDKVLHVAEVKVADDVKPGTQLKIDADVAWLVCKDVCIPGKAKLSITLPVSQEPAAKANEKVFAEWASRWPRSEGTDDAVKSIASEADRGRVRVRVQWAKLPREVELYPGRLPVLSVDDVDVKTEGARSTATVTARLRAGEKLETDKLPALLVYTRDDGSRRGIDIDIPLGALRSAEDGNSSPAKTGG